MSEGQLNEALNHSIDRLAQGEAIADCLHDYPDIADELGALLEIGMASSLNRADSSELLQMHNRLDAQMDALITATDFNSTSPFRLPPGLMVLVASLIVVFFGVFLFLPGTNTPTGVEILETETATVTEAATVTETATSHPTETITATSHPTETATVTSHPTETATATNHPTETVTVNNDNNSGSDDNDSDDDDDDDSDDDKDDGDNDSDDDDSDDDSDSDDDDDSDDDKDDDDSDSDDDDDD